MDELNHFDAEGKAVMVNVGAKQATQRIAVARGRIKMNAKAFEALASGSVQKGDVLGIARIAGIMGAKQTANLIPLCHPIAAENALIDFELDAAQHSVAAVCTVQTYGKTGVEMEALCGANISLLTIYDMCKALDKGMVIYDVCLLEKQGGKSGTYTRHE